MKLVFATNNTNKLKEINALIGNSVDIVGLKDIGFEEEIPEDFETLEENALQKARTIADRYDLSCFADDTGLEIEALDGRPGVFSARYAGPECIAADNVRKVLKEMQGKVNRKAQFRTVIALILEGKEYYFEGFVDGEILSEATGSDGFGYDPIFKPLGSDRSFAEMTLEEKNQISHRAIAVKKFVDFLSKMD